MTSRFSKLRKIVQKQILNTSVVPNIIYITLNIVEVSLVAMVFKIYGI